MKIALVSMVNEQRDAGRESKNETVLEILKNKQNRGSQRCEAGVKRDRTADIIR